MHMRTPNFVMLKYIIVFIFVLVRTLKNKLKSIQWEAKQRTILVVIMFKSIKY